MALETGRCEDVPTLPCAMRFSKKVVKPLEAMELKPMPNSPSDWDVLKPVVCVRDMNPWSVAVRPATLMASMKSSPSADPEPYCTVEVRFWDTPLSLYFLREEQP